MRPPAPRAVGQEVPLQLLASGLDGLYANALLDGVSKHRPRVTPKAPASAQGAAAAPPSAAPPGGDGRAYWLCRARRFAQQGKLDRVEDVLARIFAGAPEEKFLWSLRNAPAAALGYVRRGPSLGDDALDAIAGNLLSWPAEVATDLLALPNLPEAFVRDAWAIRDASRDLSRGDDGAALAALRRVGRDSRFRDAQRFLRGLGAVYRRDTEEAVLLLAPLATAASARDPGPEGGRAEDQGATTGYFASASAALLAQVGRPMAASPRFTPIPPDEATQLSAVVGAARAGRPNQLLAAVSNVWGTSPHGRRVMLAREVAATMVAMGVEPEAVVERLGRAIPDLHRILQPDLLLAMGLLSVGDQPAGCGALLDLAGRADSLGFDARTRAALWARAGGLLIEAGVAEAQGRCPDCGRFHQAAEQDTDRRGLAASAAVALDNAVALDPDVAETWVDYVRAWEIVGDPKGIARAIEAFVTRMPEHPEALAQAARAAGERGAFQKALTYARRASSLQPMDRSRDDLVAHLLIDKARKPLLAGDLDAAGDALREAAGLRAVSPPMRQRVAVAQEVLLLTRSDTAGAESLRTTALAEYPQPWLWELRFYWEWWRLCRRDKRSRRIVKPPARPSTKGFPSPDRTMLLAALELGDEIVRNEGGLHAWIAPVLADAVRRGATSLVSDDDVRAAVRWGDAEGRYLALCRADRRDPDPHLTLARVEAALNVGRPRAELESALAEVAAIEPFSDAAPMAAWALDRAKESVLRRLRAALGDTGRPGKGRKSQGE